MLKYKRIIHIVIDKITFFCYNIISSKGAQGFNQSKAPIMVKKLTRRLYLRILFKRTVIINHLFNYILL